MPQPRDGRRFSLEARERRGRRRSARGEDLQRDLTAEGDLGSAIDATHPAGAELRIDSITAGDDGARGERGGSLTSPCQVVEDVTWSSISSIARRSASSPAHSDATNSPRRSGSTSRAATKTCLTRAYRSRSTSRLGLSRLSRAETGRASEMRSPVNTYARHAGASTLTKSVRGARIQAERIWCLRYVCLDPSRRGDREEQRSGKREPSINGPFAIGCSCGSSTAGTDGGSPWRRDRFGRLGCGLTLRTSCRIIPVLRHRCLVYHASHAKNWPLEAANSKPQTRTFDVSSRTSAMSARSDEADAEVRRRYSSRSQGGRRLPWNIASTSIRSASRAIS